MQDIIIRGGMIIDGTGAKAYRGDVAVCDGRITAIGDLSGMKAKKTLDAKGFAVAPGFIDSHAHSDTSFLRDSSGASKLYQGVTTEVTGQCGMSPFPALKNRLDPDNPWVCESFDDFVRRFEEGGHQMAVNQAILVGHGQLREGVMGNEDRAPSEEELLAIADEAQKRGIIAAVITDWGLTEFHGEHTKTCLALEPLPAEIANELTGELPLY